MNSPIRIIRPARWWTLAVRVLILCGSLTAWRTKAADEFRFPVQFGAVYRLEASRQDGSWETIEPAIVGRATDIVRPRTQLPPGFTEARLTQETPADLNPMLEKLREKHHVPGLAAIVIRSNRVLATGAVGVRIHGTDAPILLGDLWHHGSLTKSMTASIAAMLVEEGRIQWNTTMAEIFANRVPDMHPDWRPVTLSQLLRHRSGAPDHDQLVTNGVWKALWERRNAVPEKRLQWLRAVTTNAPVAQPGSKFIYSNTGYVFAGMMLESVTGKPWETLIR